MVNNIPRNQCTQDRVTPSGYQASLILAKTDSSTVATTWTDRAAPSPCPAPGLLATCAVVFGKVVEGMAVVKRMEVCGTKAGKPSRRVIIEDCGQVRGWRV